ncbi:hypothetical protein GCM10010129_67210 [Streptomyces fumigatiscleroticus]|nr:hypothetical protein GCM10010129_67210 [Streptomyces fumigatiscleroticus]
MVEARVDQAQTDHRPVEEVLGLLVRRGVGAEAAAGQHPAAGDEVVALALVDELRVPYLCEPVLAEPPGVRGSLGGPLLVAEPGAEYSPVHDGGAVRGEHHVRQAGHRFDQFDGVPEFQIELTKAFPLQDGQFAVDRLLGIHPGINGICHVEVRGPTHEITAWNGGAVGDLSHGDPFLDIGPVTPVRMTPARDGRDGGHGAVR